jgi:hypothetical protein
MPKDMMMSHLIAVVVLAVTYFVNLVAKRNTQQGPLMLFVDLNSLRLGHYYTVLVAQL